MCPAVVVTISIGLNCVVTFILECHVLIFGMDGKQQHTYQYDGNKHRLFTLPRCITTNNNKDIVVVDRTSGDIGRVVVVGWEGGLRWFYFS
jgi:hypothetical protein